MHMPLSYTIKATFILSSINTNFIYVSIYNCYVAILVQIQATFIIQDSSG